MLDKRRLSGPRRDPPSSNKSTNLILQQNSFRDLKSRVRREKRAHLVDPLTHSLLIQVCFIIRIILHFVESGFKCFKL